jgi:hypothetical protein
MINELLLTIREKSTPLTRALKEWIIDQYSDSFNAAVKGNVRKHSITSGDGTEAFQVLVNHEKFPFYKIDEELIRKEYQRVKDPTITEEN